MFNLILLRHGKSEDPKAGQTDFSRQLTSKGKRETARVTEAFVKLNLHPDMILCSTAARTVETLQVFQTESGIKSTVRMLDALYHANADILLDQIQQAAEHHNCVLLVGHNPGISDLAVFLTGGKCPPMPTSGLVILDFPHEIEPGKGLLSQLIFPE